MLTMQPSRVAAVMGILRWCVR